MIRATHIPPQIHGVDNAMDSTKLVKERLRKSTALVIPLH